MPEVVPPDETISVAPFDTVVAVAVPPLMTIRDPAKMIVPPGTPVTAWTPPEIGTHGRGQGHNAMEPKGRAPYSALSPLCRYPPVSSIVIKILVDLLCI
jgi:hypothetical protein